MKYLIYSVYDTATETFMQPIYAKTEAEALRGFKTAAQNKDNQIGQYPADYSLFYIGEYTDHNADLRKAQPECIISALEASSTSREKLNGKDS
jgi:hypothetical protein